MSVFTSLALSFQNLRTKKARTLLTAFAGSIGIIGIALILSLSNGVNNYIESVEKDTLSEYPLQIQSAGIDFSSMLMANMPQDGGEGRQDGRVSVNQMITGMLSHVNANDLASLRMEILKLMSFLSPLRSYCRQARTLRFVFPFSRLM